MKRMGDLKQESSQILTIFAQIIEFSHGQAQDTKYLHLRCLDFHDVECEEQPHVVPLYEARPTSPSSNTVRVLTSRPEPPPVYWSTNPLAGPEHDGDKLFFRRTRKYAVGDAVDAFVNICWWEVHITALNGQEAQVEAKQPPEGEGVATSVSFEDLRPTLVWENDTWTLPTNTNGLPPLGVFEVVPGRSPLPPGSRPRSAKSDRRVEETDPFPSMAEEDIRQGFETLLGSVDRGCEPAVEQLGFRGFSKQSPTRPQSTGSRSAPARTRALSDCANDDTGSEEEDPVWEPGGKGSGRNGKGSRGTRIRNGLGLSGTADRPSSGPQSGRPNVRPERQEQQTKKQDAMAAEKAGRLLQDLLGRWESVSVESARRASEQLNRWTPGESALRSRCVDVRAWYRAKFEKMLQKGRRFVRYQGPNKLEYTWQRWERRHVSVEEWPPEKSTEQREGDKENESGTVGPLFGTVAKVTQGKARAAQKRVQRARDLQLHLPKSETTPTRDSSLGAPPPSESVKGPNNSRFLSTDRLPVAGLPGPLSDPRRRVAQPAMLPGTQPPVAKLAAASTPELLNPLPLHSKSGESEKEPSNETGIHRVEGGFLIRVEPCLFRSEAEVGVGAEAEAEGEDGAMETSEPRPAEQLKAQVEVRAGASLRTEVDSPTEAPAPSERPSPAQATGDHRSYTSERCEQDPDATEADFVSCLEPSEAVESARALLDTWTPDALDEARGLSYMVNGWLPDEDKLSPGEVPNGSGRSWSDWWKRGKAEEKRTEKRKQERGRKRNGVWKWTAEGKRNRKCLPQGSSLVDSAESPDTHSKRMKRAKPMEVVRVSERVEMLRKIEDVPLAKWFGFRKAGESVTEADWGAAEGLEALDAGKGGDGEMIPTDAAWLQESAARAEYAPEHVPAEKQSPVGDVAGADRDGFRKRLLRNVCALANERRERKAEALSRMQFRPRNPVFAGAFNAHHAAALLEAVERAVLPDLLRNAAMGRFEVGRNARRRMPEGWCEAVVGEARYRGASRQPAAANNEERPNGPTLTGPEKVKVRNFVAELTQEVVAMLQIMREVPSQAAPPNGDGTTFRPGLSSGNGTRSEGAGELYRAACAILASARVPDDSGRVDLTRLQSAVRPVFRSSVRWFRSALEDLRGYSAGSNPAAGGARLGVYAAGPNPPAGVLAAAPVRFEDPSTGPNPPTGGPAAAPPRDWEGEFEAAPNVPNLLGLLACFDRSYAALLGARAVAVNRAVARSLERWKTRSRDEPNGEERPVKKGRGPNGEAGDVRQETGGVVRELPEGVRFVAAGVRKAARPCVRSERARALPRDENLGEASTSGSSADANGAQDRIVTNEERRGVLDESLSRKRAKHGIPSQTSGVAFRSGSRTRPLAPASSEQVSLQAARPDNVQFICGRGNPGGSGERSGGAGELSRAAFRILVGARIPAGSGGIGNDLARLQSTMRPVFRSSVRWFNAAQEDLRDYSASPNPLPGGPAAAMARDWEADFEAASNVPNLLGLLDDFDRSYAALLSARAVAVNRAVASSMERWTTRSREEPTGEERPGKRVRARGPDGEAGELPQETGGVTGELPGDARFAAPVAAEAGRPFVRFDRSRAVSGARSTERISEADVLGALFRPSSGSAPLGASGAPSQHGFNRERRDAGLKLDLRRDKPAEHFQVEAAKPCWVSALNPGGMRSHAYGGEVEQDRRPSTSWRDPSFLNTLSPPTLEVPNSCARTEVVPGVSRNVLATVPLPGVTHPVEYPPVRFGSTPGPFRAPLIASDYANEQRGGGAAKHENAKAGRALKPAEHGAEIENRASCNQSAVFKTRYLQTPRAPARAWLHSGVAQREGAELAAAPQLAMEPLGAARASEPRGWTASALERTERLVSARG
ncbi:hypothetical protein KFL_005540030 [Klebsormidium nitens]|uniref:Agenet domain-containing protein n=1 Tax=Klebsormidium nitens TaxID=105231 RepID=A0A1Y1IJX3_KLENI|nr:hypothetical protein KFL_005540030 [Klebsormidium nitens]|eukprot:GAQ89709.1 hypothetical protein KFL_005540030 [Klebsormidium nitens]